MAAEFEQMAAEFWKWVAPIYGWVAFIVSTFPWKETVPNVIGSLVGVLAAFRVDRRLERRKKKELYGRRLSVARYEVAEIRGACGRVKQQLARDTVPTVEVTAPGLRGLMQSEELHEHASRGLVICIQGLIGHVEAARNTLDIARQMIVAGKEMEQEGVDDIKSGFAEVARMCEYLATLLDNEMTRVNAPVTQTAEDSQMIEEMKKAKRGNRRA